MADTAANYGNPVNGWAEFGPVRFPEKRCRICADDSTEWQPGIDLLIPTYGTVGGVWGRWENNRLVELSIRFHEQRP